MQGMLTERVGGFDQAAGGDGPAAGEEHPVLNEHRQQFGKDVTQDTPGLAAARLINDALALPQLEKQLHLPAGGRQHERLSQGEQLVRRVRDQEGPVRRGELGGTLACGRAAWRQHRGDGGAEQPPPGARARRAGGPAGVV